MRKKIIFTIMLFSLIILGYANISNATFCISNFVIDSELTEEGDLYVIEKIQYYTNETVNGVTRNISIGNSNNMKNSAEDIEFYYVLIDGESPEQVESAEIGDSGVYTAEYNTTANRLELTLYTPFDTNYKTVEYSYLLKNVAVKYDDIGELYWNYIGSEWDDPILNLTINIILPESAANDTIYVYGHGSDNGTFIKDGNEIVLMAQNISAYQAVDARILFSRDAISESTKVINESVLEKYIQEEEGWGKKSTYEAIITEEDRNIILITIIGIVAIFGIIEFLINKNEFNTEKIKYYREIPESVEPELLQYIYYGKVMKNSYYVSFLNLVKMGFFKIENELNKAGKEITKIVYIPKNREKLKKYQIILMDSIKWFMGKDNSIDTDTLTKKIKEAKGDGYKEYVEELKLEKEKIIEKKEKRNSTAFDSGVFLMMSFCAALFLIGCLFGNEYGAFWSLICVSINACVYLYLFYDIKSKKRYFSYYCTFYTSTDFYFMGNE